MSTLNYNTPCLPLLWKAIIAAIGVPPNNANNISIWKDALLVNNIQMLLNLFLMCFNHLLLALEKTEFDQMVNPFTITELISLIQVLKSIFFKQIVKKPNKKNGSTVTILFSVNLRHFMELLQTRNIQSKFTKDETWILSNNELAIWRTDMNTIVADTGETDEAKINPNSKLQLDGVAIKPGFAFKVLEAMPFGIPFVERIQLLRDIINDEKSSFANPNRPFRILPIRRNHLIADGFFHVNKLGSSFKRKIMIQFCDDLGNIEQGVDFGGVFKEFLELVSREIFNDNYGLFKRTEHSNLYYPNPVAMSIFGRQQIGYLMEFVGRIIAKAIYEGIVLDIPIAMFWLQSAFSSVYGTQSHIKSNLEDLFLLDPDLYKNLMFVKNYDINADLENDLCLTFSTSIDVFGTKRIVDLIPNGRNIPVTHKNKLEYVFKMSQFLLEKQIHFQTLCFEKGFFDIFPSKLVRLFNCREFCNIISGYDDNNESHGIDVKDWRENTKYMQPYHNKHRTIKNFWNVVDSMTNEEKKKLLQFVTSTSRPPILGFKYLAPQFCIAKSGTAGPTSMISGFKSMFSDKPTKDPLPTSATCFNTLKLPEYPNKKIMKEKLLKCIKEAKGFYLA